MTYDYLDVYTRFNEGLTSERIPELIKYCVDRGCRTSYSTNEKGLKYSTDDMYEFKREPDLDEAFRSLQKQDRVDVQLWYKETDFRFFINSQGSQTNEPPHVIISIDSVYFNEGEIHTPSGVKQRSESDVMENIEDSIELSKIVYSFGSDYSYGDVPDRLEETGVYPKDVVDKIYWLNILSPKMVDGIGRDELMSAPAWRVEELGDGSILLVVREHPIYPKDSEYSIEEVEEHLGLT